jgi:KTSC domain
MAKHHIDIESSCLCAAYYDDETLELIITYTRNKQQKRHVDVPLEVFETLRTAPETGISVGNYYNFYIRGQY